MGYFHLNSLLLSGRVGWKDCVPVFKQMQMFWYERGQKLSARTRLEKLQNVQKVFVWYSFQPWSLLSAPSLFNISPPPLAGVCQVRLFRSCNRKYPVKAKHSVSCLSSSLTAWIEDLAVSDNWKGQNLLMLPFPYTLVFLHFPRFPICLKMYDMFSSFFCCFNLRKSNRARIPLGMRSRIVSLSRWSFLSNYLRLPK